MESPIPPSACPAEQLADPAAAVTAYMGPFLPSRPVTDRRDSRPAISSFFAPGLRQRRGGHLSLPLRDPQEGALCCFPPCFGLQLLLPFLNGSSWALGVLLSRGAPSTQDLDLNFGKPPLLTVVKILCPIGAKPSPRRASGHRQTALSIGGPGARGLY